MNEMSEIVLKDDKNMIIENMYYSCRRVTIRQKYCEIWKIKKRQMMIDINLNKITEEEKKLIIKCVEYYQDTFQIYDCISPVNHFIVTRSNQIEHLILFTPLPLKSQLNEYFSPNSRISGSEKQLHSTTIITLLNILKNKSLIHKVILNYQQLNISLFEIDSSPFPLIQLTPLAFINQILTPLQSNIPNNCSYCQDRTKKLTRLQLESINSLMSLVQVNQCSIIETINSYTEFERELEKLSNTIKKISSKKSSSSVKEIVVDDYYVISEIGKGSFGTIFKSIEKSSGKVVVLKESFNEKSDNLIKEERIMEMCHHPNIIKCYGYSTLYNRKSENNYLMNGSCIALEYCKFGNLSDFLSKKIMKNDKLSFSQAKLVFGQIVSSCIYLHSVFGIIHRDIKLENFLVYDEFPSIIIKLCDFGVALKATKDMEYGVGSPLYAAPEIVFQQTYNDNSDLYSLGIVLYYLIYLQFPFKINSLNELKERYLLSENIDFLWTENKKEYVFLVDLLKKLIVFERKKRMTWDQFKTHPFVVDCLKQITFVH
ncbi:protein kinase domain containing protein [Entamoeba histolytica HM-1:IMSS-B]|nr:protein kinase domain containing protein [Entamoeba histolytica HM-1:IMSS-B]GAT91492.1 protein kinase domain containing protein [Entamoeba histolytica]